MFLQQIKRVVEHIGHVAHAHEHRLNAVELNNLEDQLENRKELAMGARDVSLVCLLARLKLVKVFFRLTNF